MANTFLFAQGRRGRQVACASMTMAATAKQIMIEAAEAGCAIILPVDGVVAKEFKAGAACETVAISDVPADGMILDVGAKAVTHASATMHRSRPRNTGLERAARRLRDRSRSMHATVAAAKHAAART